LPENANLVGINLLAREMVADDNESAHWMTGDASDRR
jgi:hypothetical protein